MGPMGALWLLLALAFALLEGYALGSPTPGDTFTEQIRRLMRIQWVRMGLLAFYVWLGWHFFLEQ
jgi:uncharacterized membrane protein